MSQFAPASEIQRVYAIGDVHGHYDLFKNLISLIGGEQAKRALVRTQLVLLGNIVDLGPDSAKMVQGCMKMTKSTDRFVVLKGNHEDMMGEALSGNVAVYSVWLEFGGKKTLLNWGVAPEIANGPATIENLIIAAEVVGADVIDWLINLPLFRRFDDFLFVHAGIRPGIGLDKQDPDDLLWIRKEFLECDVSHGVVVVHGHSTQSGDAMIRPNRIGIDTDAHRTGRLTALGIENGNVWALTTAAGDNAPDDSIAASAAFRDVSACNEMHQRSPNGTMNTSLSAFGDEQLDADLRKILAPFDWTAPALSSPRFLVRSDGSLGPYPAAPPKTIAPVGAVPLPGVRSREVGSTPIDARARGLESRRALNRKSAGILMIAASGGVLLGISVFTIGRSPPVRQLAHSSRTLLIEPTNTKFQHAAAFSVRAPVVAIASRSKHHILADLDRPPRLPSRTTAFQIVRPMKALARPFEGGSHPVSVPTDQLVAAENGATAKLSEAAAETSVNKRLLDGEIAAIGASGAPSEAFDLNQARRDSIHAMRSLRRQ